MRKISGFQIANLLFWTALILLNVFYFKPIINDKYLPADVLIFKSESWRYSVVVFFVVVILVLGYGYKTYKEKLKIFNICLLVLLSLFLSYLLKNITDNFLLFLNSTSEAKEVVVVYKVIENKENKVFSLYDNKNFINSENQLNKINKYRNDNKIKSVFEYKNNDTIHVAFNKGLFGVNFMK